MDTPLHLPTDAIAKSENRTLTRLLTLIAVLLLLLVGLSVYSLVTQQRTLLKPLPGLWEGIRARQRRVRRRARQSRATGRTSPAHRGQSDRVPRRRPPLTAGR